MHVETLEVGPLGCNCSILADVASKRAIVIDPGGDRERIEARLQALGVTVEAIVHTHTHIDHVGCTAELQKASGAAASIHEGDRFLYDMLPVQAAMLGTGVPVRADMDGGLLDGRTLHAGGVELSVLHTPGHTPGSCCFVATHEGKTVVFAGDTLFRGSIGRTDLWGGDGAQILKSIHGKLLSLDGDATVIAGHGPTTTVAEERDHNPFLRRR